MKTPELTEKDIEKIQKLYDEYTRIHTDDSYVDWLLSWNKGSIYDDDIWYRDDLTQEEKEKCSIISEYELDITSRNPNYKDEYTYHDKTAYFPIVINLLYADKKWYELSTMWGQGAFTEFRHIKDFNNWEYKNKVKYYYNMITKEWCSLVRKNII